MKKVLFALLVIALVALVACAPEEEPTAPTTPTTPTTPSTTPTAPSDGETDTQPTTPTAPAGGELLTDVNCMGDTISAVVTNVGEETWEIADIKIYLNAGIDEDPGCEKDSLEPGESTVCDQIDWPVVVPDRKNVVQVIKDTYKATVEVVC